MSLKRASSDYLMGQVRKTEEKPKTKCNPSQDSQDATKAKDRINDLSKFAFWNIVIKAERFGFVVSGVSKHGC